MAATVGATLSGVAFPLRHSNIGPFISSGGNVYFFGRDSVNTGQVEPHKASAPLTSFTAQTLKTMSSATSTAIEAMGCYQNGNVVYVFAQIATGAVYFNYYTMDTDAWGLVTSATTVAAAGFAPVTGYTFVSAVYRPTAGELVLGYMAGQTAMTSTFNMARYVRVNASTGVVIGSAVNVDNGGSVNWSMGPVALGASDRVHFSIGDRTNGTIYQRTLSAANALQTFPSSLDTAQNPFSAQQAVSYASGGTTKVRMPYRSSSAANIGRVISFDSADTPTASVATATDNTVASFLSGVAQNLISMVADGTTEHLLYADATGSDLFHDTNSGSGWGTDVNELAATLNHFTANVYTRSGSTYLATVLDDAGTIKYAEIALVSGPTTYTGTASFTGAGTLAATGRRIRQGSVSFAGSGALAATGAKRLTGTAAFTGTGTLAASGTRIRLGSAALTGTGVFNASGTRIRSGSVSFAGTGTLAATGTRIRQGSVSFSGSGTLAAAGTRLRQGSASFAGSGILAASGNVVSGVTTHTGSVAFAGTGTLSASGTRSRQGAVSFAGSGTLAATGQRVVSGSVAFAGSGSLQASGTRIRSGSASFAGAGTLAADSRLVARAQASFAGSGLLEATGEVSGVVTGSVAFSGAGTLAATGKRIRTGSVNLSGSGVLAATGRAVVPGSVAFSGAGALSVSAEQAVSGSVAFSGSGALAASGRRVRTGSASFAGSGTLTGSGRRITLGSVALTGSGALGAGGLVVHHGMVMFTSGTVSFDAILPVVVGRGSAEFFGSGVFEVSGLALTPLDFTRPDVTIALMRSPSADALMLQIVGADASVLPQVTASVQSLSNPSGAAELAPTVQGEVEVIQHALAMAEVG